MTDVVLAYRTVAVFADPEQVDLVDLESRLRAIASSAKTRGRMASEWSSRCSTTAPIWTTWPPGWI